MLNEKLDIRKLAEQFKTKKRVLIENLLTPACAEACHESLALHTPWVLRYRHRNTSVELAPRDFEQMPKEQEIQFHRDMLEFDFIHYRFAMHDLFQQNKHHELYIY